MSTFSIKTQSISFSISFLFDWVWHPKTLIKFYACTIYLNGRDFFGQQSWMTLNRNLHSIKILFLSFSKIPKKIPKLYQNCESNLFDIIISPWKINKFFPSKHFDYECVKTSTWIKLNIDNFPSGFICNQQFSPEKQYLILGFIHKWWVRLRLMNDSWWEK